MEEIHYKVQVAPDHVQRLCGGTPARAISELVWNSLDADATRVQVTMLPGELNTATVIVRDNGHGIPYAQIKELFVNLGGSWKSHATKTKLLGRALHGKEGPLQGVRTGTGVRVGHHVSPG
jgi:signal transduction histidine kinase